MVTENFFNIEYIIIGLAIQIIMDLHLITSKF
jgi:hypothetical protein